MRGGHERNKTLLEMLHYDVFGSINIKSIGGASYFVTFIDDASRKVWAYPMKGKEEVFEILKKNWLVLKERLTNYSSARGQIIVENVTLMPSRTIATGLA